ncbi:MAG: hypothetical protein ABIM32_03165 [candidate division WOR-3 bacterium]
MTEKEPTKFFFKKHLLNLYIRLSLFGLFFIALRFAVLSYLSALFFDKLELIINVSLIILIIFLLALRFLLHINNAIPFRQIKFLTGVLILFLFISIQILSYMENPAIRKPFTFRIGDLTLHPLIFALGIETFTTYFQKAKKYLYLIHFLIMVLVLVSSYFNYKYTGRFSLFVDVQWLGKDVIPNYHAIADTFAIVTLFLTWFTKDSIVKKITLFIISFLILFLCGSRNSLFVFTVSWILLFFNLYLTKLQNKRIFIQRMTSAFFAFMLLAILISLLASLTQKFAEQTYQKFLDVFLGVDESARLRQWQLKQIPEFLRSDFILTGKFMYEVEEGLGQGSYVHNLLSIWMSYGLIPFIFFLAWALWIMLDKIITFSVEETDPLRFAIILYGFLSILIARAYTWPFFWFSFLFGCAEPMSISTRPCVDFST